METENKQVIEINGIKMEVDMRHAKRIDNFRVGSKVKVLVKDYSLHKVYPGVVVGFEAFEKLPTIIVAYLDVSYSNCGLKFVYVNTESKDVELVLSVDDELPINKADLMTAFRKEKAELQAKLDEVDRKEQYFLRHFKKYFNDADLAQETVTNGN